MPCLWICLDSLKVKHSLCLCSQIDVNKHINKLLQALLLGFALLATACDKSGVEETLEVTPQSVRVNLDIDADFEDKALQEDMRSLTLQLQKTSIRPILKKFVKGDKVTLNLIFSNGSSTYTREVSFTVNDKLKLEYKGDIDVPGFDLNSKWYVTAIYGGTKDGNAYAYDPNNFMVGALGGDITAPGNINIPYMSGWTPVSAELNRKTKLPQGRFSLKVKPLGYLIRLKVKNERDHRLMVRSVQVEKNNPNISFGARFTPIISKQAF